MEVTDDDDEYEDLYCLVELPTLNSLDVKKLPRRAFISDFISRERVEVEIGNVRIVGSKRKLFGTAALFEQAVRENVEIESRKIEKAKDETNLAKDIKLLCTTSNLVQFKSVECADVKEDVVKDLMQVNREATDSPNTSVV